MLSEMWTVPELGLGVVVLTNGSPHAGGAPLVRDIIDRYLIGAATKDWNAEALEQMARGLAAQKAAAARTDSARVRGTSPSLALAKYAGTYTDQMYGDVTVAVEGNRLVIGWQSYKIPLEHWHFNTFRGTTVPGAPLAGAMATFQLDARAMPSALELSGLATFNPKAPSP
jgi:hypothetical protein